MDMNQQKKRADNHNMKTIRKKSKTIDIQNYFASLNSPEKKTVKTPVFLHNHRLLKENIWNSKLFFFEKGSSTLKFITQSEDGMFDVEIPTEGLIAQTSDIKIAALVVYLHMKFKKAGSDINITHIVNTFIENNKKPSNQIMFANHK